MRCKIYRKMFTVNVKWQKPKIDCKCGKDVGTDSKSIVTSVRQPPTASATADQASQFRLSNGFEWTFWRSPVKSCCVSFLTVVRNWGQYDRFAPGDFLLFATRLGFSHLVTSRMFTNYHYSALTTLFYRETFAYSRAIDPNHVNDTHKQQELSLT